MLMSRNALAFSLPAPNGPKSQSSFHWRCSGWASAVCDFKATEEKVVARRAFIIIKNLLLWLQFTPGDCLLLTGLYRHSSGRGTWFSKPSGLSDSELLVSVDNPKLAHEETPAAEC